MKPFSINPNKFRKISSPTHLNIQAHLGYIYLILLSIIVDDERKRICWAAENLASEFHQKYPDRYMEAAEASAQLSREPEWIYQICKSSRTDCDHIITCLLAGMKKRNKN